jgi:alpha-tubulin suppressor-like RCC1 family protein
MRAHILRAGRGRRAGCLGLFGVLVVGAAWAGPPADASTSEAGSDWRQVSAGGTHTCGIRTSGRLYCWGSDEHGQLGDGGANTDQSVPTEVAGGVTNWAAVAAGGHHTCARRTGGRLFCWGDDEYGGLGDGYPFADQTVPTEVAGGATNWAAVTAGQFHTCARRTNGRLFCWGNNDRGELGDGGPNTPLPYPSQVAGNATDWLTVTAGGYHTCARRTGGRLFCWGYDLHGQLGDGGANTDQRLPTELAGGGWVTVSAGYAHTCARKSSGRLFCWGADGSSQLGDGGTDADRSTPTQVAGGGTNWGAISAGGFHTCARRMTGRLFCWGQDFSGQVGDGGTNTDRASPTQVAGGATDWVSVTAGGFHTCARKTERRLFCWGRDVEGEVGDGGTNTDRPRPTPVV